VYHGDTGPGPPVFELAKWYADAVSAAGDYWIGYCARLRCGRFSVPYASVLETSARRHALVGTEPSLPGCAGKIFWRVPALDIHACWRRSSPELRKIVYQSHDGVVDWQCLVPCGEASVGRFD